MKQVLSFLGCVLIVFFLSSCATLTSGQLTSYQTTKPPKGLPPRPIRKVYFMSDIFLIAGVGLVIDFYTGAIYHPEPKW